ncbi:hypothetical protein GCM10010862_38490 [Devosia nitrariae]|uniref:Uncharacterized protein n=2 Tax=Devosia nitrariae TaxID=2071872 RepID=A0ABQ5WAK9_9HYPH|nr:hypothetical protein GCM10010862_38490 [Devosia nitrariae]
MVLERVARKNRLKQSLLRGNRLCILLAHDDPDGQMQDQDMAVARLNIEHFRKRMAEETDDTRLATLRQLLEEEEEKLAKLEQQQHKGKH